MNLAQAIASLSTTYPAAFLRAMTFLLPSEVVFAKGHDGDYNFVVTENVASDSGGLTKYGVDQSSHPGVDIAALTLAKAADIYYHGEWLGVHGNDLPQSVAIVAFDGAVNCGLQRSIKWMQSAAGSKPDGLIGPNTLAAIANAQCGLVSTMLDLRDAYYDEIGTGSRAKFLVGWKRRVKELRAFVA